MTGDDSDSQNGPTVGKNGQVFPEKDFLLFDDMWKGKLSSKSFNPSFSKVNPNQYFCTENLANGRFIIYRKDIDGYNGESDDCTTGYMVTKSEKFSEWYKNNEMQKYYLSPDEKYALARKNYMKQWRHSYFADYYVYDLINEQEISAAKIADFKQVQYATWSPNVDGTLKLLWVDNNKDIYFSTVGDNFSSSTRVTDDGGWCMKNGEHHLLGISYASDPTKCIYNGVPEWNYEEEMVSTTNTIFWAPDGETFTFAAFDVSKIELLKYSVYPENKAASSPDEINKDSVEQYPRVNTIHYAKAASKIAKTKFYIVDVSQSTFDPISDKKELVPENGVLKFERGIGNDQNNRYFTRLSYATDSSRFAMVWSSRAGTQSKTVICNTAIANTDCKVHGGETGGIFGKFEGDVWINEDQKDGQNNMYHGWVGDFGPFEPILTANEYFTIYSKKVDGSEQTESHAYGMKIKDGYWNIARESFRNLPSGQSDMQWLTDTTDDKWVITALNFYDDKNQVLYFTGARGNEVKHRQRHVFRISTAGNSVDKNPECVTCVLEGDQSGSSHCGWVNFRRNCQETAGGKEFF